MNASDVIDGRYRLERLLGTGGMAEVWLAEDQRLRRWVAVKVLHEQFSGTGSELVAAFEREATVIARMQHQNIVGVYDAGSHDGRRYIVMEYVHGYSLRQLLETQGRMTEAEAIRYGVQIASALHYAHGQGVVHCDIKPENVLINEAGVAKVADFGVAETLTRTMAPGQAQDLLGTIAYLAKLSRARTRLGHPISTPSASRYSNWSPDGLRFPAPALARHSASASRRRLRRCARSLVGRASNWNQRWPVPWPCLPWTVTQTRPSSALRCSAFLVPQEPRLLPSPPLPGGRPRSLAVTTRPVSSVLPPRAGMVPAWRQ
ncbi:MAG: serine/threonine protein kinase [Dehalococcoidia bacterium]|nr:serine/threonine protein kinase [Dehalococcoidia bacterium]